MNILAWLRNLIFLVLKKRTINYLLHFLEKKDIYLSHVHKRTYTTGKITVAIGIAYELFPNRWTITLNEKEYHTVALVCVGKYHNVHRFILPEEFFDKVKKRLIAENNDHIKFSVYSEDGKFMLKPPDSSPLHIEVFRDYVNALREEYEYAV